VSTFHLPDDLYTRAGLDRDAVAAAFIEHDIALRGLVALAGGQRSQARRAVHFGLATYPRLARANPKLWALRALTPFEEASAALAVKRGVRLRALRSGRFLSALRKRSARGDPFALAPHGRPEVAFLWQRLIAVGSWSFPRSLLAFAALPITAASWLRSDPVWQKPLLRASLVCAVLAFYGILLGPARARRLRAALRAHDAKTCPCVPAGRW
jgi:hypothetical protein